MAPLFRLNGILLLLGFALASSAAAFPTDSTTVVLIVRHAEKAAAPADDPSLTEAGRQRAQSLVNVAGAAGVSAVYSSQYTRTRETAEPLAGHLGVPVTVRPATAATIQTYTADLAETLRGEHAGEAVLVVTHSNLVEPLVEALGGIPGPAVAEDEYDRLVVVMLAPGGGARTIRARY